MALVVSAMPFSDLTDEDLVRLTGSDEDSIFQELVLRYLPLICQLSARFRCLPQVDREDLTQEGLLGLLAAARTFSASRRVLFKTYAYSCIRNRMLSELRRVSASPEEFGFCFSGEDEPAISEELVPNGPEEMLVRQEEAAELRRCLRLLLTPVEYDVLLLRLASYSYSEIAEKLGVSPKAVDNALQRTRRKLTKNGFLRL